MFGLQLTTEASNIVLWSICLSGNGISTQSGLQVSKNEKILNAPFFVWPAKGQIIKSFGKFGKGQHYDGIDIMYGENKPIYSAYDGEVAFVGSQIKKFGNLIIVKHNQSWVTAYSNLGKYNVKVGDKIRKQQIIAFTPEDKNYFHFQLRHNRNPVNPLNYLN